VAVDGNDQIAVSTEEVLMLLGRLYLENYTLRKRLGQAQSPPAPPEPTPAPPDET
jgi:hypothetical protein